MSLSTLLGFILAFAIFLMGIFSLKSSLAVFAPSLAPLLRRALSRPIAGVAVGIVVTALVQSSSATNAIAVGFVAAGILGVPHAFSIVLGSNIGTTFTAHIAAYSELDAGVMLITVALLAQLMRRDAVKGAGSVLGGVGAMFVGLWAIGQVMGDLAGTPVGGRLLEEFSENRLGTLLYAASATAIVQSSSAVSALLVEMADVGVVSVQTAIVGVLGSNVGTVTTTLIAAAFGGALARRMALADLAFNVLSVVVLWPFLDLFGTWVVQLSGAPGRQVALAHTLFNVVGVILMLPFTQRFCRLIIRIAPV